MNKWFQFRTWHLLLAMLVCAIGVALLINPILKRQRIYRRLNELGAKCTFTPRESRSFLETVRHALERRIFDETGELRTLNARGTKLNDEDLRWIGKQRWLYDADLAFTDVTDRGIELMTELNDLSFLNMSGTRVSEKSLPTLETLPALSYLQLLYSNTDVAHSQTTTQGKIGLEVHCSLGELPRDPVHQLFESGAELTAIPSRDGSSVTIMAILSQETHDAHSALQALNSIPITALRLRGVQLESESLYLLPELTCSHLLVYGCRIPAYDWVERCRDWSRCGWNPTLLILESLGRWSMRVS